MDELHQTGGSELTVQFVGLSDTLRAYGKTTVDVLLTDAPTLLKQTGWSVREIADYKALLQHELQCQPEPILAHHLVSATPSPATHAVDGMVATPFPSLNRELNGGLPRGEITEVFGESGTGKSHFFSAVAVGAVATGKCVYISTEKYLETRRLEVMADDAVQLDRISYIYCPDLESQDHIISTQLPILLGSHEFNCVIIDSVSHHIRLEDPPTVNSYLQDQLTNTEKSLDRDQLDDVERAGTKPRFARMTPQYERRTTRQHYIYDLYRQLSAIAHEFNVALVIGNQIADNPNLPIDSLAYQGGDNPFNYDFVAGVSLGWKNSTLQKYNQVPVEVSGDITSMSLNWRMVSAIGPYWLRWSFNRIVLRKRYSQRARDESTDPSMWKVVRTATVIATKHCVRGRFTPVPFEITDRGLQETNDVDDSDDEL